MVCEQRTSLWTIEGSWHTTKNLDGWMAGWVDGWLDGWMSERLLPGSRSMRCLHFISLSLVQKYLSYSLIWDPAPSWMRVGLKWVSFRIYTSVFRSKVRKNVVGTQEEWSKQVSIIKSTETGSCKKKKGAISGSNYIKFNGVFNSGVHFMEEQRQSRESALQFNNVLRWYDSVMTGRGV